MQWSIVNVKNSMKVFIFSLVFFFSFLACKKAVLPDIRGTVVTQGGASPASYLVEIDNPDSKVQQFICDDFSPLPPVARYNCRNSVYIINLPETLKVNGTKIIFNRFKNLGPNPIWSSTHVPRDIEVLDVRKE